MCGGRGRAAQTAQPRPDHSAGAEKAVGWSFQLAWVVWGVWAKAEKESPMEWRELSAGCICASGSHHWCDCIHAGRFPAIASNELSDDLAPISRHQTHSADYDAQFAWLFSDLLLFSGRRPATGQSPFLFALRCHDAHTMTVKCQLRGRFNRDFRRKLFLSLVRFCNHSDRKGFCPSVHHPPFPSRLQRTRRIQKDI